MRSNFAGRVLPVAALLFGTSAMLAQCVPGPNANANRTVSLTGNKAVLSEAETLVDDIRAAIVNKELRADGTPDLSSRLEQFNIAALQAFCTAAGGQTVELKADLNALAVAAAPKILSAPTDNSQSQTQTGAPASSNAATSPTEKPGIPTLLGIAVENGAVSESSTDSTMTLSTTLFGLFSGFRGDNDGVYSACPGCIRLGGSATFNLTSTSDPLSQATRKQISQWQAKYSFRDTSSRSKTARTLYLQLAQPMGAKLDEVLSGRWAATVMPTLNWDITHAQMTTDDQKKVDLIPAMTTLVQGKLPAVTNATTVLSDDDEEKLATTMLKALEENKTFTTDLQRALLNPAVDTGVNAATTALKSMILADKNYVTAAGLASNGLDGAVTFGQQFPTQSTTSPTATSYLVSTGIVSYQPGQTAKAYAQQLAKTPTATVTPTSKWQPTLTTNFTVSFYTQPLVSANEKTFRGGGASLDSEWKLGKNPFDSDPLDQSQVTVSLSGDYSRLQENQHQSGKKADTAMGTLEFSIPIASGISLPLSFSVANASDLVKETYVKGNFGLSFDLSALESLLKAKNPAN